MCCFSVVVTYMSCSFLPGFYTKTATILGHMTKTHLFRIWDFKRLSSEIVLYLSLHVVFIYSMMYGSTVYIMQWVGNLRAYHIQGKLLNRAIMSLSEMGTALKESKSLSRKTVAPS